MNKASITVIGIALIISGGLYFALRGGAPGPQPPPQQLVDPLPGQATPAIVNQLEIHVDDLRQVLRSIDEAFRSNAYGDVSSHADEIVKLAKQLRQATLGLSQIDSRVIRLLIDHVQHTAHELEEAAGKGAHTQAHHAADNLKDDFKNLEREIDRLR